ITVGLKCGESLSQNDFWIPELAINLLARLYPRVAIEASQAHAEKFRSIALAINPEVELVEKAPAKFTIGVGAVASAELRPGASGWVARLNHANYFGSGPGNPYSATA